MSTTTNNAAYLTAKATSLEIKPAPHPTPADDEVVITTRAVAINPVDNFIQEIGTGFPGITLPAIPGFDVAGEVEAVGPAVTRLKAGDRVAGLADVPAGAFQEHVALAEHLTTPLPASVSWAQGAVLPMGVSVAAKALFHRDMLAMDLPTAAAAASSGGPDPGSGPGPRGRAVLIWGGATSVGSCAIQLAVAAGYEVVTTASPRNFEYVTRLGAAQVFDYNSPTVREDLLAAFGGKTVAGALANAGLDRDGYPQLVETCASVVQSRPGTKVVAMTMVPYWEPSFDGVQCRFCEPLRGAAELGSAVFHDFLPKALARDSFRPVPEAQVVGTGLGAVQKAMETLKAGVSARKIVVTL